MCTMTFWAYRGYVIVNTHVVIWNVGQSIVILDVWSNLWFKFVQVLKDYDPLTNNDPARWKMADSYLVVSRNIISTWAIYNKYCIYSYMVFNIIVVKIYSDTSYDQVYKYFHPNFPTCLLLKQSLLHSTS